MPYGSSFQFSFGLTPWVKRLIIANVAVFVVTAFARGIGDWLAFTPALTLLRPWTLVTYMFVHAGFWHLLFNMLGLFFFGPPLEERWGSSEFIKYYVVCGLGAAALSFLLAFGSSVVGASGAVYGIMLAFAMNWPDSPIYIWGIFPIAAKWLVALLAVFALYSGFSAGGGGVAHFAHLGGFVAGFLYLKLDWRGSDPLGKLRKNLSRPKLRVIPGDQPAGGAGGSAPQRPTRVRDEERRLDEVDRVLDKISRSGMGSLTPEERKLLDEVSKRYRQN